MPHFHGIREYIEVKINIGQKNKTSKNWLKKTKKSKYKVFIYNKKNKYNWLFY